MKPEELRVTNLVMFTEENIVGEIGHHNLGLFLANPSTRNYAPVELTEEWLLKFGFKKIGANFQNGSFVLWYSFYDKEYQVRIYNVGSNIERKISVEYVHSLQNLYFALTGKELKIN